MIELTEAQYNNLKKGLIKSHKENWFFEHIKNHLYPNQKVICRICNKDVDEIAEETFDEMLKDVKVLSSQSKNLKEGK